MMKVGVDNFGSYRKSMALFQFGGGADFGILTPAAIDTIGEWVEVTVTDSARNEAALQTLTELKDEVKSFNKLVSKSAEELRFQLKASLTAEEWATVFGRE